MNACEQIRNIVMDTLQGYEYCLNNDGAWNTPEGRAALFADMEKFRDVLVFSARLVMQSIKELEPPPPFPEDWETKWQPSFEDAAGEPVPMVASNSEEPF